VPVWAFDRVAAVLVADARGDSASACAFLDEAAIAIGSELERALLREHAAEREQAITYCLEKRLTRIAFDLHDGPLQDLAAFGFALDGLRRRCVSAADTANEEPVAEQFADLSGWLATL